MGSRRKERVRCKQQERKEAATSYAVTVPFSILTFIIIHLPALPLEQQRRQRIFWFLPQVCPPALLEWPLPTSQPASR